jgi:hypothetical protein
MAGYVAGDAGMEAGRLALLDVMKTGLPPANASVRLARFDHAATAPSGVDVNALLPDPVPVAGHSGSILLGFLYIETFISNVPDILTFSASTPDSAWLVRVWPPQIPETTWPPVAVITQSDIDAMREKRLAVSEGVFGPPERALLR